MATSVNSNIEIKKAIFVIEPLGPGVSASFPDDGGCRRLSSEGIVVVQYDAAVNAIVQADAPHALLLSTASTSANSLFYGGCAVVAEPVVVAAAAPAALPVLYTTSNLLQTTDSAQLPVVLITRAVLHRSGPRGPIRSVSWTKLRAPPEMPMPAALVPYQLSGAPPSAPPEEGVLYCAQGNLAPGSSGLIFMPRGKRPYPIVNNYYGRDLNSVRDVAVHPRDGALWFTDPRIGFDEDFRQRPQLPCHVYRFDTADCSTHVVADGLGRPTSLCFDPAGRVLYVSDTDTDRDKDVTGARRTIYAYDVLERDGAAFAANRRVFAYALRGAALCVRCDAAGNVFAACDTGVEIWSARGTLLAVVDVPGPGGVSSLCFTTARCDELIVCAGQELWWMQLRGAG